LKRRAPPRSIDAGDDGIFDEGKESSRLKPLSGVGLPTSFPIRTGGFVAINKGHQASQRSEKTHVLNPGQPALLSHSFPGRKSTHTSHNAHTPNKRRKLRSGSQITARTSTATPKAHIELPSDVDERRKGNDVFSFDADGPRLVSTSSSSDSDSESDVGDIVLDSSPRPGPRSFSPDSSKTELDSSDLADRKRQEQSRSPLTPSALPEIQYEPSRSRSSKTRVNSNFIPCEVIDLTEDDPEEELAKSEPDGDDPEEEPKKGEPDSDDERTPIGHFQVALPDQSGVRFREYRRSVVGDSEDDEDQEEVALVTQMPVAGSSVAQEVASGSTPENGNRSTSNTIQANVSSLPILLRRRKK